MVLPNLPCGRLGNIRIHSQWCDRHGLCFLFVWLYIERREWGEQGTKHSRTMVVMITLATGCCVNLIEGSRVFVCVCVAVVLLCCVFAVTSFNLRCVESRRKPPKVLYHTISYTFTGITQAHIGFTFLFLTLLGVFIQTLTHMYYWFTIVL
jgi:hypothetical protein